MTTRILLATLLLSGLLPNKQVAAQVSNAELYQAAYSYLNDSVLHLDGKRLDVFYDNCSRIVVGAKQHFEPYLQVATRRINHYRGFPISDFVIKKYGLTGECLAAIRMGIRTCDLANHIQDSLAAWWEEYVPGQNGDIQVDFAGLPSKSKMGHQVFFSDIYKNSLMAELDSFCSPYDQGSRYGAPTFFFFVFNSEGEIQEVYSGKTIHYN